MVRVYAYYPKMEMSQPESVNYEQHHTKFLVNWRSQSCKLFLKLMTNFYHHGLKIVTNDKLSATKKSLQYLSIMQIISIML